MSETLRAHEPRVVRWLLLSSVLVSVMAMAGLGLLLLLDQGSGWFDRLAGAGLLLLLLAVSRNIRRTWDEDLHPVWRPRTMWDVLLPFAFPLWLGAQAADRASGLRWLAWSLLTIAVLIQVAIWRLERSAEAGADEP